MKKIKNLDGFMIGRASIGNPWCFGALQDIPFARKIPLIQKHAEYLIASKGEKVALFEIRKHLVAYVKKIPNASHYRSKLVRVTSLQQICDILTDIHSSLEPYE